jgi:NADPH-dependent ferric siderophore reductase
LLDVQPADKDMATKEKGGQQPIRVYPVRQAGGEQLVSKLRSQFDVVNHEMAEARFAFEVRTGRLIVIAAENLQAKISAAIAALDGPPG